MSVRKPLWTEGLFIAEHHLQQQDRYHEQYVSERLAALGRPSWGLIELVLDSASLAKGQFKLRKVVAVMPDGTPLHLGDNAGKLPKEREVHGIFGPAVRSLPVFLALPLESAARGNVGGEGTAVARYASEQGLVADFNAGGREQGLTWLNPDVRLIVGDESKEGFATLQVADLIRTQAGSIVARDTFVAPSLALGASEFLLEGTRRVAAALATRSQALSQTRRQRAEGRLEFDASETSRALLLATLNRNLPLFSHIVANPMTHPESLYLALVALAGELCTFSAGADASSLSKYSYLDLGDTFEPLFARVLALINTTVDERFTEVPLRKREDGMYLGRFEDEGLLRQEFFIAARSTLSEAELHQQLPKLSKVASWNQIGGLLNSALNGAKMELEFRPSAALPVRPGITFFRLQKSSEYWSDIAQTRTIALYHPLGPEAVTLSLYAVSAEEL
jgi:type VI secretion system protein ImpJ